MKRKVLALVLAFACTAASLTGCGNANEKERKPSEREEKSSQVQESTKADAQTETGTGTEEFDPRSVCEGVKLTIAMPDNVRVEDYETNLMTVEAEEALGLDIEFMVIPSADYSTKLNLMINSGETLPDIMVGPNVLAWSSDGVIIPLDEYYEKPELCPNITRFIEEEGVDVVSLIRQVDGHVYGNPWYSGAVGGVWEKLWVYEPWLKAIGKDVPQTTEEFYEVCKLIAATDLNGNGKKDEIALLGASSNPSNRKWTYGWFAMLMSPYVYAYDTRYLVADNGNLKFAFETEEWKEGLKYIKKFFDDGLIPAEALLYNEDQVDALNYAEEQVVFSFVNNQYRGSNLERGDGFVAITALEGPSGLKQSSYMINSAGTGAAISADCKNPEAAFILLDYWSGEKYGIMQRFGEEGVNWDYWENARVEDRSAYRTNASGYDFSIYTYDDAGYWRGETPQNASFMQTGFLLRADDIVGGWAKEKDAGTPELVLSLSIETKRYAAEAEALTLQPEEAVERLLLSVDEEKNIGESWTDLLGYVEEMKAAFLTGEKDIDAEWDGYLSELKAIGSEEILKVYQTGYDRTK